MHFLVQTVQAKFPEIVNFDSELRFLEKAAVGKVDWVNECIQHKTLLFIKNLGTAYNTFVQFTSLSSVLTVFSVFHQ